MTDAAPRLRKIRQLVIAVRHEWSYRNAKCIDEAPFDLSGIDRWLALVDQALAQCDAGQQPHGTAIAEIITIGLANVRHGAAHLALATDF